MKIAVILLSCLVAVSYQQKFLLSSSPIGRNYWPFVYGLPYDQVEYEAVPVNEDGAYMTRAGFQNLRNQYRLFFNGFGNNAQSLSTTTIFGSTTSWVQSVSTVTTASVQNCIPLTKFADDGGSPPKRLTAPCARRRREVALLADALEPIAASEPEQVETSVVPELPEEREVVDEPLLVSSKDDVVESSFAPVNRLVRNIVISTSTITFTSTSTSYSFVPTVVKKTFSDAVIDNGLKCLPPVFVVC